MDPKVKEDKPKVEDEDEDEDVKDPLKSYWDGMHKSLSPPPLYVCSLFFSPIHLLSTS